MQLLLLGIVGLAVVLLGVGVEVEEEEVDERLVGTPEKRVGLLLSSAVAAAAAAAAAALLDAKKVFKAAVATAPAMHPKAKFTDMV
jgi:hypothetical protein